MEGSPAKKLAWAVVGLLAMLPFAQYALAVLPGPGEPVDNQEQRVSEHGVRFGADQFVPDVSGSALVWQDQRGGTTTYLDSATGKPLNRIWFKSLATRDESAVATLSTDFGFPRISGSRVVWNDFVNGNHDIFTRVLPTGPIHQLTTHGTDQMNPAIDGNTIVWEDYRNGNADIYSTTIGGACPPACTAQPITMAKGRQVGPSVSGNVVAWRDSRRGPTTADVWTRTGTNPAVRAVRVLAPGVAKSFSEFQVAVSGNRLLWNEAYPTCTFDCGHPKIVKTCVLPGPCGTTTQVDSLPNDPDDGGSLTSLDLSSSLASWVDTNGAAFYTVDPATCPGSCTKTEVDAGNGFLPNGRLDGNSVVWSQSLIGSDAFAPEGLDVLWDDRATPAKWRRANSIGLGQFGQHLSPAAAGSNVLYRAPGTQPDGGGGAVVQVWATSLAGTRRHFQVSTFLGTDSSRPAIVGTRAAWSDLRNCPLVQDPEIGPHCQLFPADDSFQRSPLNSGPEVRISDPELTGGPVDASGNRTAWRCGDNPDEPPNAICVYNGASVQRHDVSGDLVDPASTMTKSVRISGNLVVWGEGFFSDPDSDPQIRLHVRNLSTGDDEIVACDGDPCANQGTFLLGFFDTGFDISGSTVVFATETDIMRNTVTGCGGGGNSCDHSGGATVFQRGVLEHSLTEATIDSDRVAWVDCEPFTDTGAPACDIYTKTLSESVPHLVTNDTDSFVQSPYVDNTTGRVYWVDHRNGNPDIFMEAVDSATPLPQPDALPPSRPTGFTATPLNSPRRISLSWTNPLNADFFRVRILRTSGPVPPNLGDASSTSPPFASLIYEGNGTSFTDTDVAPGRQYSYSIFAFDLEPNFSARATAIATVP